MVLSSMVWLDFSDVFFIMDVIISAISVVSLVIFRGLLKNETIKALVKLLNECSGEDTGEKIKAYSEFVYQLYKKSENLTDFMLELVLED